MSRVSSKLNGMSTKFKSISFRRHSGHPPRLRSHGIVLQSLRSIYLPTGFCPTLAKLGFGSASNCILLDFSGLRGWCKGKSSG